MNDEMAEILLACGKPIVDVYYEKPRLGVAVVKTNHAQIGRLAADHFISRRFSHFAFCGFAGGRFSHYCLLAFSRALAAQGHRCEAYQPDAHARYDFDHAVLINERLDLPPDRVALRRWVKSLTKPVAVFCPNDLRAWQLLQVCQSVGIRVPQDVAIMGLDNDFVVCGFSNPMLSSIDPDTAVIGRTAAKTLREMMDDDGFREKTLVREVAPKGVVERDSTAIYPLDPPWLSDALLYINHHIADNLRATDVYRATGRSHTAVNKAFKNTLGHSVQHEIALTRLSTAKHLLTTTRLPATEIARRCGFASLQYFIRVFTNTYGQSPVAWRATL